MIMKITFVIVITNNSALLLRSPF